LNLGLNVLGWVSHEHGAWLNSLFPGFGILIYDKVGGRLDSGHHGLLLLRLAHAVLGRGSHKLSIGRARAAINLLIVVLGDLHEKVLDAILVFGGLSDLLLDAYDLGDCFVHI
jgi:hypothetical protein